MGDLIAVQDDIANDISRGLRLKLAPKDEARLTRRRTESSEAYRLYLLSRHELNKPSPEGPRKSLEYAQQATEKDPTYAPAYAALARAYIRLGIYEMLPRGRPTREPRRPRPRRSRSTRRCPKGT